MAISYFVSVGYVAQKSFPSARIAVFYRKCKGFGIFSSRGTGMAPLGALDDSGFFAIVRPDRGSSDARVADSRAAFAALLFLRGASCSR